MAARRRAELDLSYTRIVAPFEGMVGLSAVDVGALVAPDSGSLVTLTRLDPINVEFPVATAAYLRYREAEQRGEVGREANVQVILPNGTTYPKRGKINFVASDVAQGTDTVIVRAGFDNPDAVLLDGALVRVTLEDTTPQNVLAVPQQAVQRDQAGAFVMVVGKDSTVELRRSRHRPQRARPGSDLEGPRRGGARHHRRRRQGHGRVSKSSRCKTTGG